MINLITEKEEIWEAACRATLKDISISFLAKRNQSKVNSNRDRDIIQAIGETIQNFPIPPYFKWQECNS